MGFQGVHFSVNMRIATVARALELQLVGWAMTWVRDIAFKFFL